MGRKELQGAVPLGQEPILSFTSSPEREGTITLDYIRPIDFQRTDGLEQILSILKDSRNKDHIAGITSRSTVVELLDYYREKGRHGFVGISKREVVGVYDLSGPETRRVRRGNQEHVIANYGNLNRMCVRADVQGRGIGQQLTDHALQTAHVVYGWSNLLAGIVLDEEISQRIQRARSNQDESERDMVFREIFNELKEKDERGVPRDARVRLFVVRSGFQYSGFGPNVTVGGQPREVLMISHPNPDVAIQQDELLVA